MPLNAAEKLPVHLRKYIVEQNYEKYTPADQACWRYILRQLTSFLSTHAHECYLKGLKDTGIEIDQIPKISNISEKLKEFGWYALPVSGFIPPAAFMELQSLGVLPIASDMRSLDHLEYTPAPDIVHEAAGHAPILIQPEFADYLRQYAQVAKKAIISSEDLALYEAIRDLSDIKEKPNSTESQIEAAQKNLDKVSATISHVSEAGELGRMNWWTAEYGLIGDIKNPKIFGAGLLSSVGESKHCQNESVKKIPLTVDCVKQSYDITEQQPQLFVADSFQHLKTVLNEFSKTMAFKKGGIEGLTKALKAASVNTVQLNSGIQISGILESFLTSRGTQSADDEVIFIKTSSPTQLCFEDKQLDGQGKNYHQHGYSTILGPLSTGQNLSAISESELKNIKLFKGEKSQLEFQSGFQLTGILKSFLFKNQKLILLAFENCTVTYKGKTFFKPEWGIFDMAVGETITSVFGGPADRTAFGETDDFVAKKIEAPRFDEKTKQLHKLFLDIRMLRESSKKSVSTKTLDAGATLASLQSVYRNANKNFSDQWLLKMELLEIAIYLAKHGVAEGLQDFKVELNTDLGQLILKTPKLKTVITDGLHLSLQI